MEALHLFGAQAIVLGIETATELEKIFADGMETAVQIDTFDPQAEEILFVRPIAGG